MLSFPLCPKRHGGEAVRPPPNPLQLFFNSVGLPLSIYRSIYLSINRSIYLSTYLSIYLSTYLPMHLSTHLPTYLSFCHSSVPAFLMLPPPSSIQNAFSTFFLVFSLKSMLSFCFLLKSLLSLYVPTEIFTFSSLVGLLKSLLSLLKSLLSLYLCVEFPTFAPLFRWNPYLFLTFPLKSLPSLHFSIEILTFSVLFCWISPFPPLF